MIRFICLLSIALCLPQYSGAQVLTTSAHKDSIAVYEEFFAIWGTGSVFEVGIEVSISGLAGQSDFGALIKYPLNTEAEGSVKKVSTVRIGGINLDSLDVWLVAMDKSRKKLDGRNLSLSHENDYLDISLKGISVQDGSDVIVMSKVGAAPARMDVIWIEGTTNPSF